MENNLFQAIKESIKGQYGDVIAAILPGGKVQGNEYVCGSLSGGPGDSCKTNIRTGVGKDFATGEAWRDVIDLAAQAWNKTPLDAAYALAKQYGIAVKGNGAVKATGIVPASTLPPPPPPMVAEPVGVFKPIMPIPENAPELPRTPPHTGKYCYRNAQGEELFYILRYDEPGGGKSMRPVCYCADTGGNRQWCFKMPKEPRPLYGLDRLAKVAPDAPGLKAAYAKALFSQNREDLGAFALSFMMEDGDGFDINSWPKLSRETLPGIVGEFVDLATADSEADPAAVLVTMLVRFAAEMYGYSRDKGRLVESGRTAEREGHAGTDSSREGFQRTVAEIEQRLAGVVAKRAAYNVGRYGAGGYERGDGIDPPLQAFEHGLRQAMAVPDGVGNRVLPGDIADGLAVDGTRRAAIEQAPGRTEAVGAEMPDATGRAADAARSGGRAQQDIRDADGQDFGRGFIGEGREPLCDSPAGERERPHNRHSTGNQIEGINDHEQNRTGTHSVGLSGTDRRGSEGGPSASGRNDTGNREQGERLRAALDALERVVSALGTACQKLGQYLEERRTVTRDDERKNRGMSR
jgi:hypothetical protein